MDIQVTFFHQRRAVGTIQAPSLAYARRMGKRWVQTETPQAPGETRTAYPTGTDYRIHSGYSHRTATISAVKT